MVGMGGGVGGKVGGWVERGGDLRGCFVAAVGLLLPVTTTAGDPAGERGLVGYAELKGGLMPAGDSSASSQLDANASSLHLRGKGEGFKTDVPAGISRGRQRKSC